MFRIAIVVAYLIYRPIVLGLFVVCTGLLLITGCGTPSEGASSAIGGEQFESDQVIMDLAPKSAVVLPKKLVEISGLAWYNDTTLVAVQDERAVLYFIHVMKGRVLRKIEFGKDGDYEGIAIANDRFYALKSSGTIMCFDEAGERCGKFKFEKSKGFDFEGICYDKLNDQLIISCKQHGDPDKRNKFHLYAFSLSRETYKKKPIYSLSKKGTLKGFQPSGVAVHPSGDLCVISSPAHRMVRLNREGKVAEVTKLSKKLFTQPEGITFGPDGTLYISNEGRGGKATLLAI